ncbi:SLOG family protein [Caulobacter soli]|uniref:SLOG family protein n=1 Tax=Caulobacter soli TaxID=2708539 RepID=UPI0013EB999D|nr:SLOG family protein [Caulobacter soli]
MTSNAPSPLTGPLTAFEAQALTLDDPRPHPPEDALTQLGHCVMTELLDLIADTALEDFQATLAEALIGAFHSAAQRIEREADRARDSLREMLRDLGGPDASAFGISETEDANLQEATVKAHAADIAVLAVETIRNAASQTYTVATGEVWTPWRGGVRASRTSAAMIEARAAIRAAKARRDQGLPPGAQVVAFRAAPRANTAMDNGRVLDALNWALETWPSMVLATTGAEGPEKHAIKWAKGRGLTVVLAKPEFDRFGRSAVFRCNDELLDLEPVCVLTLDHSLDVAREPEPKAFGPAKNLAQKALASGVRALEVRLRG